MGEWRVDTADAFTWLAEHTGPVVASIPTATEVGMDPDTWWAEFVPAAIRACTTAAAGAPMVFIQTDRRANGHQYSWPLALAATGRPVTWHRLALTRYPGAVDLHRPTYRHVIAFGGTPGPPSPDVWHDGPRTWGNGTGIHTATRVARWFKHVAKHATVLNPFCGEGALMIALNAAGLDTIGCDIDPATAATARHYLSNTR